MAEDKNTSQINMRIPGMKGGPRNRGAVVEKPVNSKETFMRLMQYFAKEIPVITALYPMDMYIVLFSGKRHPFCQGHFADRRSFSITYPDLTSLRACVL